MSSVGLKFFFTVILNFILLNLVKTCSEDPVKLDQSFVACCRGRPKYTSEPCIDSLLENGTFSPVVSKVFTFRKSSILFIFFKYL